MSKSYFFFYLLFNTIVGLYAMEQPIVKYPKSLKQMMIEKILKNPREYIRQDVEHILTDDLKNDLCDFAKLSNRDLGNYYFFSNNLLDAMNGVDRNRSCKIIKLIFELYTQQSGILSPKELQEEIAKDKELKASTRLYRFGVIKVGVPAKALLKVYNGETIIECFSSSESKLEYITFSYKSPYGIRI